MGRRAVRSAIAFALLVVSATVSSCAVWEESESDAIRRAVIAHELDEQGIQVDDLVIRLSPGEFRADFGHGSRMVWLVSPGYQRQYREGEYFATRDPKRSYLFVQDVSYEGSDDQARVGVVLYDGEGQPANRELTLRRIGGAWRVTSQRQLGIEQPGQ